MSTGMTILMTGGKTMSNPEDKTLAELTALLRQSVKNAEDLVEDWGGEYLSPSLAKTVEYAKTVLKELDQNKALLED